MIVALDTTQTVLWDLRHWLNLKMGWTGNQAAITLLVFAVVCMIIPYLLGSINPAIVFSKRIYKDDVRTHGSGNAGSTNMLRTFGFKAAALTFVCDMLKTVVSIVLGRLLLGELGMSIAGFFAMFGHMFPLYYKFKGGKGVACTATIALLISPPTFLCTLAVFIVVLIGTKMVSMASVMAALLYPLFMNAFAHDFSMGVAMAVAEACFVVFMHRENLKRIWNYEERKVDFSKITAKFKRKKKSEETVSENVTEEKPDDRTDGGKGDA